MMKAVVTEGYGPPERLQLKEVDTPIPNNNEVLIKVHASSLNAADFEIQRGSILTRITGPLKPKNKIPGTDVAGVVEAVGTEITKLQPGDEVMGDLFMHGAGAFAEYVCAPEEALTPKPSAMTFEEAATYPQAAVIALQSIRGKHQIQPGQRVLINGAGGGMGTFAIQIRKYHEAQVTGVGSAKKPDMIRSIGADHVLDYKKEDYAKTGERYDLILDTVARRSIFVHRRTLNPGGMFVMLGGSRSAMLQTALLGPLISRAGDKWFGFNWWAKPYNKEDMDLLTEPFEAGKVVPVIDRRVPLSEVPEAMKYLEDGLALGKVVVSVSEG
ncbi:MAG: NAD(P)-dependent alcohol dehydrogenase [Candidatus Thorarchaeota archaeon]